MSLIQAVFICSNSRASKRGVRSTSLASASDGARFSRVVSRRRTTPDAPPPTLHDVCSFSNAVASSSRVSRSVPRASMLAAASPASSRPNSDFSSPSRRAMSATTLAPRVAFGSSAVRMPAAPGKRRNRRPPVDVGGSDVEVLARDDGVAALEVLHHRGDVDLGRRRRAQRRRARDEAAEGAVAGDEVGAGDAVDVGQRRCLDPVAALEAEAPVADGDVFRQRQADALRVVQGLREAAQPDVLGALELGRGERRPGDVLDGRDQRVARGLERLVVLQLRAEVRVAGLGQRARAAEGARGEVLLDQRLVEPELGAAEHQAGERDRGEIGRCAGRHVVQREQDRRVADAAQGHGALAVLGRLERVGRLEHARRLGRSCRRSRR